MTYEVHIQSSRDEFESLKTQTFPGGDFPAVMKRRYGVTAAFTDNWFSLSATPEQFRDLVEDKFFPQEFQAAFKKAHDAVSGKPAAPGASVLRAQTIPVEGRKQTYLSVQRLSY